MTAQTNNRIARNLAASPVDLPLADDVIAEDHAQGCVFAGRAAVEALLREFFVVGFPNARCEVQCVVASEEGVAFEITLYGRQDGSFLSIPPTGREVRLPMTIMSVFDGSQVRRLSLYYDAGTLLRQLGLAL
jgi:predicted ester cyclase